MAKLIKSILANRMMFRGGGLVPPSQAAGILASSSPLIDSVALNQGGLVNYARGGIALGARPAGLKQSVPTTYMDIAGVDDQLPSPSFLSQEDVTRPVEGYEDIDQGTPWWSEEAAYERSRGLGDFVSGKLDERSAEAKPFIDTVKKVIATADAAGDDVVEAVANTLNVTYEKAANIVNQVLSAGSALEQGLGSITDSVGGEMPALEARSDVSVAEQLNGASPMAAVAAAPAGDMIPGGPPEASWTGYDSPVEAAETAEANPPAADAPELKPSERYEDWRSRHAGWMNLSEIGPDRSGPETALVDDPVAATELERKQAQRHAAESFDQLTTGPTSWAEEEARIRAREADEEARIRANEFNIPPFYNVPPLYTDQAVSEESASEEVTPKAVVAGDMIPGGPPEASLDIDKIVTGDGDGDGGDGGDGGAGASGFVLKNTVKDGIVEAAQTDNPEDLKDWIKVFKEEFIDAAPEYEGASDFEKGMAWVKTGMAIAGGTSPHAIKNIADGFLSTIDEHTTDAKEKRQYERQINLSAANYAITANNKRRDEERAIEREGQIPIEVMALENMYDPEGKLTRKKGDIFNIPKSEFQQNPNLYGGELAIENDMLRRENNMNAFASMLETAKDAAEANSWHDVEGFAKLEGNFRELRDDAQKYINQHNIVSQSIELVGPEGSNVLGLKGAVKRWLNKGYNFLHLNRGSEGVTAETYQKAAEGITEGEGGEKVYDANIWVGTNKAGKRIDELGRTYEDRVAEFKEIDGLWSKKADLLAEEGRDGEKYLANQQRLANLLIRELLGEGSKNISNIDRELAQQIVGLYESNAFQDPAVLMERLVYIQNDIVKNYTASRDAMDSWIDQFGAYTVGAYSPTVTTSGAMVPDTRRTVKQTIVDPSMQQFSAVDEESNWKDRVLKSSGFVESIGEDGVVRYKLSGGN